MSKIAGPRAIRNQERYIQEALQQKEKEHELELSKQQSCISYESTASAAQKYVYEQIIMAKERNKDCFHNHINDDGNDFDNHAISFWSSHLLSNHSLSQHHEEKGKVNLNKNDLTSLVMKRTSFAKCTSFTNDIRDGRLNHASN